MNTKLKFQSILLILLMSLLALSFAGSRAFAQVGGDDNPEVQSAQTTGGVLTGTGLVPGGPGFIMVSAFDFHPYLPTEIWSVSGSGIINNGPEIIMVTGLSLPHGATITKMTLYYRDVSADKNIRLVFSRGDGLTDSIQLANIFSSGTADAYRYLSVTSFVDPVIDNQLYSYYLMAIFPAATSSDVVLAQVRLDYDYPSYLPTVMK